MFAVLQDEARRIIDDVISLCYWMRGAIGYEEMMRRTPGERQRMVEFINTRLEVETKKMNPNY